MKNIYIALTLSIFTMISCVNNEPKQTYVYEKNPAYSWGYAEFFGAYYADYGNANNDLSLSLFTDSLKVNNSGNLTGYGQYLFLEDIFIATTDTLLPQGTYTISDSGEPFTVASGLLDTIDNETYTLGATISYYEPNSLNSTIKLISSGSFTLSYSGTICTISCDFVTSDNMQLKGSFSGEIPYYDESLLPVADKVHRKIKYMSR